MWMRGAEYGPQPPAAARCMSLKRQGQALPAVSFSACAFRFRAQQRGRNIAGAT